MRKQGKGTFVTAPAVRHDLRRLHGLLGSLFSQAQAPSSRLLRYELCNPPPDAARSLRLRAGRPALALDRLYLIDVKPAALAQICLVPHVAALPRAMACFGRVVVAWQDGYEVRVRILGEPASLRFPASPGHAPVPDLAHCADLDLGFTPATNLLPIRRMHLQPGEEAEAPAAWLDLSEDGLGLLEQRYACIDAGRYRYASPRFGYDAELSLSEHGFVLEYPQLWSAEA